MDDDYILVRVATGLIDNMSVRTGDGRKIEMTLGHPLEDGTYEPIFYSIADEWYIDTIRDKRIADAVRELQEALRV